MRISSPEIDVAVGRYIQPHEIPSHSLLVWCDAIICAFRLTRAFDSGGALEAQRMLSRLHVRDSCLSSYPRDIRLYLARRDAMVIKAMINLLVGSRLCFAMSFAICAGLRRFGFPCHIVVGYERIHQYTETPMDAYVHYEGEPVSTSSEVKYSFVPVLTYG